MKVLLTGSVLLMAAAACGGFKVVLDADMGRVGDLGSVTALHAMADEGRCEIAAMGVGSPDDPAVSEIIKLNALYGRPHVPIGYATGSGGTPDVIDMYRKVLAEAPNRNVIICSVGFLSNMRQLLESGPDRHSRLNGRDLVAAKVFAWCVAAFRRPDPQRNAAVDADAARIALADWPTPVVFTAPDSRVAVFAAVRCVWIWASENPPKYFCPAKYYFNAEKGTYRIAADGSGVWTADGTSRNLRLAESVGNKGFNYPGWAISNMIEELVAREPRCRRAGHADAISGRLDPAGTDATKGTLTERPVEKLDRGLVASVTSRGTYVSWRLLDTDPADIAFDVWRKVDGRIEKLNDRPIIQTSDFWLPAYTNAAALYSVDGSNFLSVACSLNEDDSPYQSIRLSNANDAPARVGVGDLDGDGKYDFVVKLPSEGTDPAYHIHTPSKRTCRLEAYRSDGKFLWSRDYGWNIELGAWYSPYVVVDMDGDGKAEVLTKIAPLEPDYRDPDGRVQRGPEYLAVLNGLNGETIATTPWPPRTAPDPVQDYNYYFSRNQIGVAYLDGKTPCAIVERGTYGRMVVDAFRLRDGKLERLWRFDNESMSRRFWGQGDHAMLCCDVDGDGFDEVLIGSLTLDHDGTVLWCNGRGHSDAHYYGDIDPCRPGMELFFLYETPQPDGGGLLMADPATGKEIWKLPEPTHHVHSFGICSDIDPAYPGLELYGQDVVPKQVGGTGKSDPMAGRRWYYAADGTLIKAHEKCRYGFGHGRNVVWWDADLQREIIAECIRDHEGTRVGPYLKGGCMTVDLYGDWREEVIVGRPGELRIFTTDIPAMDRRVTLMRDRVYRSRIAMETSGYTQQPILGYVPSAVSPNVSLRIDVHGCKLRFDVTAPLDKPLEGRLSLDSLPEGWSVDFKPTRLMLKPGRHWTRSIPIKHPESLSGRYDVTAVLTRFDAPALVVRQPQFFRAKSLNNSSDKKTTMER